MSSANITGAAPRAAAHESSAAGEHPRRVLLTGAAGFIGAHVARLLVRRGHFVTALLRPGSDRWRIADLERSLEVVEGDLSQLAPLAGILAQAQTDLAIHLAWKGWAGQADPAANLTSLENSLALLRLLPRIGCPRVVLAGTCFEYQMTGERLSESSPLVPHEIYGACKKSLFEVARAFSSAAGLSVATARVFYAHGPGEDPRRFVPSMIQSLLKGEPTRATRGEQVRDYLHVEDIASAIWSVANAPITGAVNVASGEAVTLADIARQLGTLIGRPDLVQLGALPYRSAEPMHIVADVTRLRRELEWSPKFGLTDGLGQTVNWWRERLAPA